MKKLDRLEINFYFKDRGKSEITFNNDQYTLEFTRLLKKVLYGKECTTCGVNYPLKCECECGKRMERPKCKKYVGYCSERCGIKYCK